MAIISHLQAAQTQKILKDFPLTLIKYLQELEQKNSQIRLEFDRLSPGQKNERILDDGLKAIEQCYLTTTREKTIIESHQKYLDFQLLIEGEEYMETIICSKLQIKEPYQASKDLTIYQENEKLHLLKMEAGDFAIFMPEDAHRSTLAVKKESLVRKVVIKIPSTT